MLDSSLASIENWYSYVKTKNSRNQKFNQLTSQYTGYLHKYYLLTIQIQSVFW